MGTSCTMNNNNSYDSQSYEIYFGLSVNVLYKKQIAMLECFFM